MENNENKNGRFSNFMSKAADLGKKAADGISNGAKKISNSIADNNRKQQIKKYNPIFKDDFRSKKFKLPNVIEIVDDAVRKNIKVCEGAIGWIDKINGVEIFHLYDEWIVESKIKFVPVPKCDGVYCVDNFDRNRFISAETIFGRATNEKLAELEHIAYSLGARSCSIEILDSDARTNEAKVKFNLDAKSSQSKKKQGQDGTKQVKSENYYESVRRDRQSQSGKAVSYFEGNNDPKEPTLKWFANDDNILGLIKMRCSNSNAIKSKVLELKGSSSATMSQKTACAIDKILKIKASVSMEKQSIKEHSSVLVFEIEF